MEILADASVVLWALAAYAATGLLLVATAAVATWRRRRRLRSIVRQDYDDVVRRCDVANLRDLYDPKEE